MDTQPIINNQQNTPVGADYHPPVSPISPVIPSVAEGSKPSSHLFPIILSSLVTILILVGVYFLFLNKTPKSITINPSPTPTLASSAKASLSADPTSTWKTYTNSNLGFEIKYPEGVMIEKEMNDEYNRATIFRGDNLYFEVMLRKAGDISLDKYYYMDNEISRKSTLDGKTANVYINDASKNKCVSDGSGPGCPLSFVTYVAQSGSDLYHVGFYDSAELSDIENQILSTFKFTSQ